MIKNKKANDLRKVKDLVGKSTKELYNIIMREKRNVSIMRAINKERKETLKKKNSKNPDWKQGNLFL
jgi:hypothetical protein